MSFYKICFHQDGTDNKNNKSSLPLASFNYINSIIGSGVIGKYTTSAYYIFTVGIYIYLDYAVPR
jgi:hypothetical protein